MMTYPFLEPLRLFFNTYPFAETMAVLCAIALVALIANLLTKRIFLRVLDRLLRMTRYGRTQDVNHPVISRLANIVPAIVVISGIHLVPHLPEVATRIITNVANAFIIVTLALAISAMLDAANSLYMRRKDAASKPIKGYIQLVKLAVFLVSTILVIATLIDKSPLILLSGLGALAAVLMLVFQDTLLSLVASIQISSSDMVRVGDWIEMPQLNADGDVIDIALHTVKVQNWDKTITTLPTRRLITDPFKNWRGMVESGGRRIKRAIFLDQNSIRFLSSEEIAGLRRFALLRAYLDQKEHELHTWNSTHDEAASDRVNQRRLTNIGTFRAYVRCYLEQHHGIHAGMTLLVRQLGPGATGLPLEIYCFTNTTAWAAYETIQSDIFDHLYAILPEFGLRAFQQPAGADLHQAAAHFAQNALK